MTTIEMSPTAPQQSSFIKANSTTRVPAPAAALTRTMTTGSGLPPSCRRTSWSNSRTAKAAAAQSKVLSQTLDMGM